MPGSCLPPVEDMSAFARLDRSSRAAQAARNTYASRMSVRRVGLGCGERSRQTGQTIWQGRRFPGAQAAPADRQGRLAKPARRASGPTGTERSGGMKSADGDARQRTEAGKQTAACRQQRGRRLSLACCPVSRLWRLPHSCASACLSQHRTIRPLVWSGLLDPPVPSHKPKRVTPRGGTFLRRSGW